MNKIIAIAALLPAVIAMIYIYRKDRVEKEPFSLLFRLTMLGAIATIVAALIEDMACALVEGLFDVHSITYAFIENFLLVAFIEECLKYLIVRKVAWRNKAFNYRFDAVIYCVFSSLGFAALENLFYIQSWGLSIAFSRAVLSVPLHAFCGVFMGIFMGHAKAYEVVGNLLMKRRYLRYALIVPTVLHGFYDFCLSFSSVVLTVIFIGFVILLYVCSIKKVRQAAAKDCPLCANWQQPFQKMNENDMKV